MGKNFFFQNNGQRALQLLWPTKQVIVDQRPDGSQGALFLLQAERLGNSTAQSFPVLYSGERMTRGIRAIIGVP